MLTLRSKRNARHFSETAIVALIAVAVCVLYLAAMCDAIAASKEHEKPAHDNKIIGLWEQYDDDTKQLASLVRIIRLPNDHFEGVVEKIIPGPSEEANPHCTKCTDARKDQPVLGMHIITNLGRASKTSETNETKYDHGEILDPDTGDVYRLQITVIEDGKKLEVRGYLGIALFGRTQVWRRVAAEPLPKH